MEPAPDPSLRAGRPVDPALSAIALRCLEREPEHRYQSIEEVIAALRWELTPGELRRGAPLGAELRVRGELWRRVDAINVGDPACEEPRALSCRGALSRVRLESSFPNGRRLRDEGLCHTGELSLQLSGLTPGKEALLLLRLDVAQPQDVETLLDGVPLITRAVEVDPLCRWRHETVLIPAERVTRSNPTLSRRPRGASAGNLYAVFLYQR